MDSVPGADIAARRRCRHRQLGSHKGKAVRRAIRAAGAHLLLLPPYSPDLNPIEQVFAKLKALPAKGRSAIGRTGLEDDRHTPGRIHRLGMCQLRPQLGICFNLKL